MYFPQNTNVGNALYIKYLLVWIKMASWSVGRRVSMRACLNSYNKDYKKDASWIFLLIKHCKWFESGLITVKKVWHVLHNMSNAITTLCLLLVAFFHFTHICWYTQLVSCYFSLFSINTVYTTFNFIEWQKCIIINVLFLSVIPSVPLYVVQTISNYFSVSVV